jgi:hypothetical protein
MNCCDLLCSWIEIVCGENGRCQGDNFHFDSVSSAIFELLRTEDFTELARSSPQAIRNIFEAGSGLSADFVADQQQEGGRFRSLTMVGVNTREAVAIEVGQSLKGNDVATLSGSKR